MNHGKKIQTILKPIFATLQKRGINEVGDNAKTKRQTKRHGARQAGVRAVRGIGKSHECVRDYNYVILL